MKTVILAIAAPMLAACGTTPKDERWFPAADTILEGFDAAPPVEFPFLRGDSILYGVSIPRPEERKTWLIKMEVVEPFDGVMSGTLTRTGDEEETEERHTSLGVRLRITLYDEQGAKLGENESRVPADFLRMGFHEASRNWHEAEQLGDELRTADMQELLDKQGSEGLLSFIAFTQLIRDNELLSPILWEAMSAPNLLGILFNFGVTVTAGPSFNAALPYE